MTSQVQIGTQRDILAVCSSPRAPDRTSPTTNTDQSHTSISAQFQLLLTIFAALDKELLPESDPGLAVQLSISPPLETGLPAGAAPSEIQDTDLRAEYEAALAANRKRAANAILQQRLHESESKTESALAALVAEATPQQLKHMEYNLKRSRLSDWRKARLAALLKKRIQ